MSVSRRWELFESSYRTPQMEAVAHWIRSGLSGSVVGLAGCGKSNFLGFLCYHPDVLQPYLGKQAKNVMLIPVDLNSLPAPDISTLYRVILRSFYEVRQRLDVETQELVKQLFDDNRAFSDPFLPQTALRELLFYMRDKGLRVTLVIDRFDKFSVQANSEVTDILRSLRDSFREMLIFIVSMRQEPKYLLNPENLGELYEVLDLHVCRVGPLDKADSIGVMSRELRTPTESLNDAIIEQIYALTGGYPSLLKGVCHWHRTTPELPSKEWLEVLMDKQTMRHRLQELWDGLTQAEQLVVYAVGKLDAWAALDKSYASVFSTLEEKGLLKQTASGWQLFAKMFEKYLDFVSSPGRGKIWYDEGTNTFFQGNACIEGLTPLQAAILNCFIRNEQKRMTLTEIINCAWPPEDSREGVTNEVVARHIRNLREIIEPLPSKPCYIITWRGNPEGGYQFFSEGKPVA